MQLFSLHHPTLRYMVYEAMQKSYCTTAQSAEWVCRGGTGGSEINVYVLLFS